VLNERRRNQHGKVIEATELLYADRRLEHVERLGPHALRGEFWDKAVTYLREAGVKATNHSANQAAVAFFEQALTALTHLPETRETTEKTIESVLLVRSSFLSLAEFPRLLEYA